ncbi:MAG: TerD family protein [Tannerellaceae bacterium]|jgi:tellurium resistance protein TerD|nr:TerD family protein [Tannerellaceae bacterium]
MAIKLEKLVKGQRIGIGLSKVSLGLGWDPNQGTGADFDLDASAFMLGSNGKVPQDEFFVFYHNPKSPDGAVESSGDDTTGGNSDGDDETLTVDLTRIDPRIESIIFTVTIYDSEARRQNFGQVRNSFIRIYNTETGEVIAKYELEEDFSVETAVEFGRLYKKGDEWKFEAMGIGYKGGLEYFLSKYV